jgi:membrane protease YdiL (CAAX protease family)
MSLPLRSGIGLVADKTNSLLAVAAFHSLNNFFDEYNLRTGIIIAVLLAVWIVYLVFTNKKLKKAENIS